jgi:hypothetical protein
LIQRELNNNIALSLEPKAAYFAHRIEHFNFSENLSIDYI